jgi:thiamine biosynthesis protein ThiS
MHMQLKINGETKAFDEALSVDALINALELDARKVAIERNMEIVPRSQYTKTTLQDGDAIEIIGFMGGG